MRTRKEIEESLEKVYDKLSHIAYHKAEKNRPMIAAHTRLTLEVVLDIRDLLTELLEKKNA